MAITPKVVTKLESDEPTLKSDLVKAMHDELEIEERKTKGSSAKALYVRRRTA